MARRKHRKQKGGGEGGKGKFKRDYSEQLIGPDGRRRVSLAFPGRQILAPPPGPINARETTDTRKETPAPVRLYVYPTRALPQYKTTFHRNKTDNVAARLPKYRTRTAGPYVTAKNTSHYREQDKVRPRSTNPPLH